MTQRTTSSSAPARRIRSIGTLARSMRELLGRADMESEDHRKAALRRLLHEHAAGLTREEIEDLVLHLRGRFPDRIFESDRSARGLASRSAKLETELSALRAERNRLRERVDHLEALVTRLARAVQTAAGRTRRPDDSTPAEQSLPPETLEALGEVAALLFPFALNQERTAWSVEETLGRDSSGAKSESLAALLPRLVGGEPLHRDELDVIHSRLRALQLLPGALMAGVQQSWKGGTRDILEHLDPKAVEKSTKGVFRASAVLKEVNQRFEQFWNQFDRNIEHYYRGRFERVYKDKMEDVP